MSYVIQSHLHRDHTGSIGRFPNAEHIVQRIEYEYAFEPEWFMAGAYQKKDFGKPGLKWRMLEQEEADTFDLFGDAAVRLISTPGHSIGHQSMILKMPRTGHILLTADATYTKDHWDEKCLPGFSVSNSNAVRSVRKLHEIAAATGALVVPGHVVPIPGTKRRTYLEENLGAADIHLLPDDVSRLDQALTNFRVSGDRYGETAMAMIDR